MNKFVVYTVQVGGYDVVQQPLVVDERFDYVLFTDSEESKNIGIWQVRTIPYENSDLTRVSRYPKMHPNELLNEYEASLYIDANIQITGQRIYDRVVECYEQGIDWAGIQHPKYNCIYEDAYNVMALALEKEYRVFEWCHILRTEQYPRNNGLLENNIIFRRHTNVMKRVNNFWWELYQKYTRRDQLTLKYVLWKCEEVKVGYILSPHEMDCVNRFIHKKDTRGKRNVRINRWEHFRQRCRVGLPSKYKSFQDVHYHLYRYPYKFSMVLLDLWTIYAILVYGMRIKYDAYKRHKQ